MSILLRVTAPKDRAEFARRQVGQVTAVQALPHYQQEVILDAVERVVKQEVSNCLTEVSLQLKELQVSY